MKTICSYLFNPEFSDASFYVAENAQVLDIMSVALYQDDPQPLLNIFFLEEINEIRTYRRFRSYQDQQDIPDYPFKYIKTVVSPYNFGVYHIFEEIAKPN